MVFVGFHASHEQLPPSALLRAVRQAEDVGFDGAMCSDHLAPWTREHGESGFAWSWLGAALASTSFSLGVVNAPGQRYHPVIIAQAIATLEEMFPGRFWAALGSGEAINEHVTGDPWPPKEERDLRLEESVDVIRRLFAGERVSHRGRVVVDSARLWTRPATTPPLITAAISAGTARRMAAWADGMVTVGLDDATLSEALAAYSDGGGKGPRILQVHLSLGATEEEALDVVRRQWNHSTVGGQLVWDLAEPEDFESRDTPEDEAALRTAALAGADAAAMAHRIAQLVSLGFDRVYLHSIGDDQAGFLHRAERELLPALREATA
jgi:probable non-F420 flavinoid oxidoreductase